MIQETHHKKTTILNCMIKYMIGTDNDLRSYVTKPLENKVIFNPGVSLKCFLSTHLMMTGWYMVIS